MTKLPLLITVAGPTATGKTALAVALARVVDGEIISADSRQVFRRMDIGTGKDKEEFGSDEHRINCHLIDILEPGEEYNAYRFQNDFIKAWGEITARGRQPIMCGGTGLYVDAIVRSYRLADAPVDPAYRASLEPFSDEQLTERLAALGPLHNHTDTESRDRLVRALEIQEYALRHPESYTHLPAMRHAVFALTLPREETVARIERRLRQRLQAGMADEVQALLDSGLSPERLERYGLEYRHLTLYLTGRCSEEEMFANLFTDIRRFAKRQMTWLRRMERCGVTINWLDARLPLQQNIETILEISKPGT
ncbi:MAG: tRNA (adenosine(37)-N6)-dimethylallyltransferase MiaA [Bacteroidales bacterium]|nr:tRNA (adenosine(37)-N6)-dimethylallyltransferase MiaA [Bacteroidales bacterium]